MKRTILQALFWLSLLEFLFGIVVSISIVLGHGSPATTRGAFVLLVVGAWGCWWFRSALARAGSGNRSRAGMGKA